jgi:hypothetical protein
MAMNALADHKLVDRLAQEIRAAHCGDGVRAAWMRLDVKHKQLWRSEARAAITFLRSELMIPLSYLGIQDAVVVLSDGSTQTATEFEPLDWHSFSESIAAGLPPGAKLVWAFGEIHAAPAKNTSQLSVPK